MMSFCGRTQFNFDLSRLSERNLRHWNHLLSSGCRIPPGQVGAFWKRPEELDHCRTWLLMEAWRGSGHSPACRTLSSRRWISFTISDCECLAQTISTILQTTAKVSNQVIHALHTHQLLQLWPATESTLHTLLTNIHTCAHKHLGHRVVTVLSVKYVLFC